MKVARSVALPSGIQISSEEARIWHVPDCCYCNLQKSFKNDLQHSQYINNSYHWHIWLMIPAAAAALTLCIQWWFVTAIWLQKFADQVSVVL